MYMDEEETTLASEILAELKASAKRWFIAFLVMVGIELATIAGFLWYISLPVEESINTQTIEDIDGNGDFLQRIGDDYGESDSDLN